MKTFAPPLHWDLEVAQVMSLKAMQTPREGSVQTESKLWLARDSRCTADKQQAFVLAVIELVVLYPLFPVCVEGKTLLLTSSVAMRHPAKRSPKWRSSFQKCRLLSKEWLMDHMKTVCSRAFWEASDTKPVHSEWISQILFSWFFFYWFKSIFAAEQLNQVG